MSDEAVLRRKRFCAGAGALTVTSAVAARHQGTTAGVPSSAAPGFPAAEMLFLGVTVALWLLLLCVTTGVVAGGGAAHHGSQRVHGAGLPVDASLQYMQLCTWLRRAFVAACLSKIPGPHLDGRCALTSLG